MKSSELCFKCLTGSVEHNTILQKALFSKGIIWINSKDRLTNLTAIAMQVDNKMIGWWSNNDDDYYRSSSIKEVSFAEALMMIEQVEDDVKILELPFKMFDYALFRDGESENWDVGKFIKFDVDLWYPFLAEYGKAYDMIAPLTGNEDIIGKTDTPAVFYSVDDGVLIKNLK